MEAIEFALAEPDAAGLTTVSATCRDVHDGRVRPEAILDFCPRLGSRVRIDAPIDCVEAEDIVTAQTALVPAELVFIPFRPSKRHASLFGTTSNGLASGNTRLEATVHALCEVLERDIKSFEAVEDTSVPVDLDSVEGPARTLVETIREVDLDLYVRTVKNAFGMAYFLAFINDRDAYAPHLLNGGFGCHPHRSVAFIRAVAEAAQSRLSFIHGGRDDLTDVQDRYRGWNREAEARVRGERRRARVARAARADARGRRRERDGDLRGDLRGDAPRAPRRRLDSSGSTVSSSRDPRTISRSCASSFRARRCSPKPCRASACASGTMRAKRADDRPVIFLGPTLATLPARARSLCRASGFHIRRPVRRGDVEQLVAARKKAGAPRDRRRRLPRHPRGRPRGDPGGAPTGLAGVGTVLDGGNPGARDGAPRDARVRQRVRAVRRRKTISRTTRSRSCTSRARRTDR